jgi:hypothetical protein
MALNVTIEEARARVHPDTHGAQPSSMITRYTYTRQLVYLTLLPATIEARTHKCRNSQSPEKCSWLISVRLSQTQHKSGRIPPACGARGLWCGLLMRIRADLIKIHTSRQPPFPNRRRAGPPGPRADSSDRSALSAQANDGDGAQGRRVNLISAWPDRLTSRSPVYRFIVTDRSVVVRCSASCLPPRAKRQVHDKSNVPVAASHWLSSRQNKLT